MSDYVGKRRSPDGEVSEAQAKRDARRRRIRTRFQAFVGSCSVLLVVVPLVMELLDERVPPVAYGYLAAASLLITQAASVVTRIMTAPAVNSFIDAHIPWLSSDASEPVDTDV